jgi:hypothetical protein
MKPSTQDRTEGKLHEVKGKVKEGVGKVTNESRFAGLRVREENSGRSKNRRSC